MTNGGQTPGPWADARLAAALLAIDPGLGGMVLTARSGPVRDAWLDGFHALLEDDAPWRRVPANINDEALFGGLDLAATLKAGRPVRTPGLLAEIKGGVGVIAMAERASPGLASRLAAAIEGPSPPLLIALDESSEPDEATPATLAERLALHVDLSKTALSAITGGPQLDREMLTMAKVRLPHILNGDAEPVLTAAALALGIDSLRPVILALRAARAAAALDNRDEVAEEDLSLVARLVLAPRATQMPAREEQAEAEQDQGPEGEPEAANDTPDAGDDERPGLDDLTEIMTEAARAALPEGLLARLEAGAAAPKAGGAGKAGAMQRAGLRGRPAGAMRGHPGEGRRLDLLATLRAAAPWGRVRRRGLKRFAPGPAIEVRREDFRIKRFKPRSESETIFVVDASGSLALNRLSEAKGAVELMLAQSYVRRDHVAVIAFRGAGADMLLPSTRSLARAKRSLAALPGGGGTPLAAAIQAADAAAQAATRQGRSPTLVFLTDGAANITRDGGAGREIAQAEARQAGRQLRTSGYPVVLVDVSKRGSDAARALAQDMGARYARLPVSNPGALAQLAREAAA